MFSNLTLLIVLFFFLKKYFLSLTNFQLDSLIDFLSDLSHQLLLRPDVLLKNKPKEDQSIKNLRELLLKSYLRGVDINVTLIELKSSLEKSRNFINSQNKLKKIFTTRILILVVVIYFGRILLEILVIHGYLNDWNRIYDTILILIGFFILFLTMRLIDFLLKKNWFWEPMRGLTHMSNIWLSVKLDSDIVDSSLRKKLDRLTAKEFRLGVDLQKEKDLLLEYWVQKKELEQELNLRMVEDIYPLIELIISSFLVICLLTIPLLESFQLMLNFKNISE